jgi:hypothetical protein
VQPELQGIYRLPHAVDVDFALLRAPMRLPIRLGGEAGTVEFPRLVPPPEAGERPQVVSPPLTGLRNDINWPSYLDTYAGWGMTMAWNTTAGAAGKGYASIEALAMRFPLPDEREESAAQVADRLFGAIPSWSARLMDWLEVATGQDLDSSMAPSTVRSGDGLDLHRVDSAGKATRQPSERPMLIGPMPIEGMSPSRELKEAIWRAVLNHMNSEAEPPIERLLLRDARAGLRHKHPRRAVLDGGTAAEIVLTQLLDGQLTNLPPRAATLFRKQNRQLGPLIRVLDALGVVLPEGQRLQQELVDPRNQAIHGGQQSSIEEASRAVGLAHQIVEYVCPLQNLLMVASTQPPSGLAPP